MTTVDAVKILDSKRMEEISSGSETTANNTKKNLPIRMRTYYCYRCNRYEQFPTGYEHWDGNCPICKKPMRLTTPLSA